MAGKVPAIEVIDVAELWHVLGGGVDKQTAAAKVLFAQATSAMEDVARSVGPKDGGMTDVLFQLISQRRSGPGPSSAPALPPTSTLTR